MELILVLIGGAVNIISSKFFVASMLRKLYLVKNFAPITEIDRQIESKGSKSKIIWSKLKEFFATCLFGCYKNDHEEHQDAK